MYLYLSSELYAAEKGHLSAPVFCNLQFRTVFGDRLVQFFVDWGTDIYPIQVWETFIIALTYPLLLSPQQQTKCFSYIH